MRAMKHLAASLVFILALQRYMLFMHQVLNHRILKTFIYFLTLVRSEACRVLVLHLTSVLMVSMSTSCALFLLLVVCCRHIVLNAVHNCLALSC